jgi:ABC-type uncharacterized transport system involved in gliding motility auxiliary subunit
MAEETAKRSIWKKRAWRAAAALSAGATVALALALVVLVNLLSARFPIRHDFSRAGYYQLSEKTLSLLREVKRPIEVIALVESDFELVQEIRSLLREYEAASPRLRVRFVDPGRDIGEARNLARKFGLAEANSLVLEVGGRFAVVEARKMMEYNYWPLVEGRPKTRVAFRGEQMISTAIQGLLQPRLPLVGFTSGHGEGDVDAFGAGGYSRIGLALRRDALRAVKLNPTEPIPEECSAVVVLGPSRAFSASAVAALRAYLDKGGRALFLIESSRGTGLEPLLEDWGLRVGQERIGAPALTGSELLVSNFGDHPATRGLRNMACAFYAPHPVLPLAESDRHRVSVLASSPANGWIETNPAQDPPRFDPGADKAGPAAIAAAVERGVPSGLKISLPPTRLVVVGDADFAANGTLTGGNEDFFLGALNWLLEREHLVAVSPRLPDEIRMDMNGEQRRRLFLFVVAGLPGAALLLAFLVAAARRR